MPVNLQARPAAPKLKSWPTMKDEDKAHSLICAVDSSLADCIQLLREVFFFSFPPPALGLEVADGEFWGADVDL